MISVQSWLLLPSSWCEDEHLYPTPLDQGSEQPLFQPLDHQATSLPSRGERAFSQVGCTPTRAASCSFVTSCKCSQDPPAPGVPSLQHPEHVKPAAGVPPAEPLLSFHCLKYCFSFPFLGSECFLKARWQNNFDFHKWSQEFQSKGDGGFDGSGYVDFRSDEVFFPPATFGEF